jgi:hypothetical protein
MICPVRTERRKLGQCFGEEGRVVLRRAGWCHERSPNGLKCVKVLWRRSRGPLITWYCLELVQVQPPGYLAAAPLDKFVRPLLCRSANFSNLGLDVYLHSGPFCDDMWMRLHKLHHVI